MKTIITAFILFLVTGVSHATIITDDFTVKLDNSQINRGLLASNDVWKTPELVSDPGSSIIIASDVTYAANIVFSNGRVTVRDTFLRDDMESIHIDLNFQATPGPATVEYKFWFTGVEGELLIGTEGNPITGQFMVSMVPLRVPHSVVARDINLIANGQQFSFADIHVELTTSSGSNLVSFQGIRVGVDGDRVSITIPEPEIYALLLAGLLGFVTRRRRRTYSTALE